MLRANGVSRRLEITEFLCVNHIDSAPIYNLRRTLHELLKFSWGPLHSSKGLQWQAHTQEISPLDLQRRTIIQRNNSMKQQTGLCFPQHPNILASWPQKVFRANWCAATENRPLDRFNKSSPRPWNNRAASKPKKTEK